MELSFSFFLFWGGGELGAGGLTIPLQVPFSPFLLLAGLAAGVWVSIWGKGVLWAGNEKLHSAPEQPIVHICSQRERRGIGTAWDEIEAGCS